MALRLQPESRRPTTARRARMAGRLLAFLISAPGVLCSTAVDADNGRRYEQRGPDQDRRQPAGREHGSDAPGDSRNIGPARAAAMARSRFGGRVLKVQHRGAVYRVKLLLPDGKVKSVYIDAAQ